MTGDGLPAAILFDAGGTLVHLDPVAVGDALEGVVGIRPDADRMVRAHYRAMFELGSDPGLAASPDDTWWPWWVRRFLTLCGCPDGDDALEALGSLRGVWTRPVPGGPEAVRAVRDAGLRVGVVSNADGTVEESLDRAGYGGLFEFVIDSHLVGVAKPDPEIFDHAMTRLDLDPAAVWYVGDSIYHDVGGAAAAGLAATVLVDPLDLSPDHLPRVASVAELPRLLSA